MLREDEEGMYPTEFIINQLTSKVDSQDIFPNYNIMPSDSQSTIWQTILENSLSTKKIEIINVIVLGDKKAGKKRIIEMVAKSNGDFILY